MSASMAFGFIAVKAYLGKMQCVAFSVAAKSCIYAEQLRKYAM